MVPIRVASSVRLATPTAARAARVPDNGLGDGGHRLHDWLWTDGAGADLANLRSGGVNGPVIDEFMSTGAVVAGGGTFEPAGGWGGNHHDDVPIFIYSRQEPATGSRLEDLAERLRTRAGADGLGALRTDSDLMSRTVSAASGRAELKRVPPAMDLDEVNAIYLAAAGLAA